LLIVFATRRAATTPATTRLGAPNMEARCGAACMIPSAPPNAATALPKTPMTFPVLPALDAELTAAAAGWETKPVLIIADFMRSSRLGRCLAGVSLGSRPRAEAA
jgi:hypothetical protein